MNTPASALLISYACKVHDRISVGDYLASLYTMGNLAGKACFIAPAEPGMYKISMVRDMRQVLEGLPAACDARDDKCFLRLAAKVRRKLVLMGQSSPIEVGSPELEVSRDVCGGLVFNLELDQAEKAS